MNAPQYYVIRISSVLFILNLFAGTYITLLIHFVKSAKTETLYSLDLSYISCKLFVIGISILFIEKYTGKIIV